MTPGTWIWQQVVLARVCVFPCFLFLCLFLCLFLNQAPVKGPSPGPKLGLDVTTKLSIDPPSLSLNVRITAAPTPQPAKAPFVRSLGSGFDLLPDQTTFFARTVPSRNCLQFPHCPHRPIARQVPRSRCSLFHRLIPRGDLPCSAKTHEDEKPAWPGAERTRHWCAAAKPCP